ncbi:MAG: metal ABC transporter permease [Paracoccaceae bacterium]
MDDFLLRAALAGAAIAVAAAPLGCLVVWRRMAYFGDATAHAAILGVALGLALSLPVMLGVVMVAAALAVAITYSGVHSRFAMDTVLGVFAHCALASGLVLAAVLPGVRINLLETLLGDILSVTAADVATIWAGAVGILMVWGLRGRRLVNMTLSPELAVAEGGSAVQDRLLFSLCLAVFVALAMKLVGVLLITAMLILPAAAARPLSRTPEQMVGLAAVIGLVSVGAGLALSWFHDTPAGPSIIVAAGAVFLLTNGIARAAR